MAKPRTHILKRVSKKTFDNYETRIKQVGLGVWRYFVLLNGQAVNQGECASELLARQAVHEYISNQGVSSQALDNYAQAVVA
ncbi:MAG: hypothetical protein AAF267_22975 [Deinococcota bacterium]